MSKYIIDTYDLGINPIKVLIIGEGTYKEKYVEDLEELCDNYIRKEYGELPTEAYKRGYDYGLLKGKHDAEQDMYDKGYQKGFEDGKGAIHKGCEGCRYSGTPQGDSPCFSCSNYYPNNWQKQDDNIEVGDEVDCSGDSFIVTRIFHAITGKVECDGVDRNGCTYHDVLISGLTKTGRHVDIDKILGELRE